MCLYQFNNTGHEGIVRLLIGNGADVNLVDQYNSTALIVALQEGIHWTVVKSLCKSNLQTTVSFFLGFDKIAEVLIQNGADVNARNNKGSTALTWAAETGKKIAKLKE